MTMDDVLAQLKGKAGVEVSLTIRRGDKLTFPVKLTREVIEVPTVKHAVIHEGGPEPIGYLKLITFSSHTAERAREAIEDFKNKGYKALILDLRQNYGGLLQSAVNVCNLFLDGGTIVSIKSRVARQNMVYQAGHSPIVPQDMPVIVLIDRGSASASEITAGALKDRKRAYLVGEKSYGKGSVQQVFPLDTTDDSGMKLTMARYYTPSDVNIDKIGIPPDKEVLFPTYTDEQADSLNKLYESNEIPDWVKANPGAKKPAVDTYAATLAKKYGLDAPLIARMVRDEQRRTEMPVVYDLDYDIQLKAAVDILDNGTYKDLMASTETLAQLQAEQKLKVKDKEK
jgi:carboxyl-terminal processing protease